MLLRAQVVRGETVLEHLPDVGVGGKDPVVAFQQLGAIVEQGDLVLQLRTATMQLGEMPIDRREFVEQLRRLEVHVQQTLVTLEVLEVLEVLEEPFYHRERGQGLTVVAGIVVAGRR